MQPFEHRTVLRREAVDLLAPAPGKVFLDGTLGGGGHAEALLDAGARVIGLDQDPAALRAARARLGARGERFVAEQANFRDARSVLDRLGVREVDGALVDLGVSSPQLDDPARGFSFRAGGPLDMRMDPTRGEPLSALLVRWDEKALARIVGTLGEERFARPIARAIHRAHREGKLEDTAQLADVVARSIPRKAWPRDLHPATRTFQALRIAVNDELGALSDFVGDLPRIVARGGRAAAISFHSLGADERGRAAREPALAQRAPARGGEAGMSCAIRKTGFRGRRAACGLRQLGAATLACALLAAAALLQIWVRTRVTEQGYRLSRLSAERQQLVRDHERLQLAAARLGGAQRIEDLARARLGMGPPPADRIIVLVGGALRSSASMVASK